MGSIVLLDLQSGYGCGARRGAYLSQFANNQLFGRKFTPFQLSYTVTLYKDAVLQNKRKFECVK